MTAYSWGDFSFLKKGGNREMLEDAFQAVTAADAWELLKHPSVPGEGGFMFSSNPDILRISSLMKFEGHSGGSFGMTMRQMEYIAKHGWESYVSESLARDARYEAENNKTACGCRQARGYTSGWCGVAGGGVPACDH